MQGCELLAFQCCNHQGAVQADAMQDQLLHMLEATPGTVQDSRSACWVAGCAAGVCWDNQAPCTDPLAAAAAAVVSRTCDVVNAADHGDCHTQQDSARVASSLVACMQVAVGCHPSSSMHASIAHTPCNDGHDRRFVYWTTPQALAGALTPIPDVSDAASPSSKPVATVGRLNPLLLKPVSGQLLLLLRVCLHLCDCALVPARGCLNACRGQ
jgi:hypothetical protein